MLGWPMPEGSYVSACAKASACTRSSRRLRAQVGDAPLAVMPRSRQTEHRRGSAQGGQRLDLGLARSACVHTRVRGCVYVSARVHVCARLSARVCARVRACAGGLATAVGRSGIKRHSSSRRQDVQPRKARERTWHNGSGTCKNDQLGSKAIS
jgi:hypothetical protein